METNDKNPNGKESKQQLNEGFSGENIPPNYNEDQPMQPEIETDQSGNKFEVKRDRFPHSHDQKAGFDRIDTHLESRNNKLNGQS